ncbi:MAG TPA: MerR family transcriptional regulator [Pseudolabrys sp.]|nr:MerR family transcriptional regulator [Pseudolabrys sp.]
MCARNRYGYGKSLPAPTAPCETRVEILAVRLMAQNANVGVADWPDAADGDAPMTIGEVARDFGVTLRALRFYEAKRLIAPRRYGPLRLYSREDCQRLALILTGRRLGFTLAEIKSLLNAPGNGGLHLTREKCVTQINLLERQKRSLEVAIVELRQIYTSFYKIRLDDSTSS